MKKVYRVEGIDCANCANKIEELLNKNDLINSASVSFLTQKVTVEFKGEVDDLLVLNIITSVEKHAKIK